MNVETTQRGVEYPTAKYLSFMRNTFERSGNIIAINDLLLNMASEYLFTDPSKAIKIYERIIAVDPDNTPIMMLLAILYLIDDQEQKALDCFYKVDFEQYPFLRMQKAIFDDFMLNKIDRKALQELYLHKGSASHTELMKRRKQLQVITRRYPQFKAGWLFLAYNYRDLGHEKMALKYLHKYESLERDDPFLHFSLAHIYYGRENYNKSLFYLKKTA